MTRHADLRNSKEAKAVVKHWHILEIAGHPEEFPHQHRVLLGDPDHAHFVAQKTSRTWFVADHLDAARDAAAQEVRQ